ncbi:bifunctional enoyl-CoA hydratase/phosphate acetyltransferase [Hydrogenophaga sp.]|uniref:bifunctional enoyl-CoA hydratase/phosphate acetyltransferase n=1 Tax=Hydrogenophaga sp. TaxID=1904254 RepID=UPI0025BCA888|nr:bifunctional enoyl-CoA hydratase/phosphate acetyltransferase [Hydrogenophaga sp.]
MTPIAQEAASTSEWIENLTFDELSIGQSGQLVRKLKPSDIEAFAAVSGDVNPAHLNADYANASMFHGLIAHGMWGGALISALLGTQFPGPGTIYLEQVLHFSKPVRIGDTLTVLATVSAKDAEKNRIELDCQVLNQRGERVLHGLARVIAPTQKVRLPRMHAPQIGLFDPLARFRELLALGDGLPPVRCAVVHPCDADSLKGVLDATRHGVIEPLLVGPEFRLRAIAEEIGMDLQGITMIPAAHSHDAAEQAVALAVQGQVQSLIKGSLSTGELIHAVQASAAMRTGRLLSHVYRFDVPLYAKPLLITDTVLNMRPDLEQKADILRNAIQCAHAVGLEVPRVAVLSAVEIVNPAVASSIDAAALCKMAERGQITGCLIDGPLTFDDAISIQATHLRQIDSAVAGQADVLLSPDFESGNMLARQLQTFGGATASGVVLGARVPIALSSRSEGPKARVASAVLAQLVAHRMS